MHSIIPFCPFLPIRLSLTTSEICHDGSGDNSKTSLNRNNENSNNNNNDDVALKNRFMRQNLTDMADWVYDSDGTGDLTGDLTQAQ